MEELRSEEDAKMLNNVFNALASWGERYYRNNRQYIDTMVEINAGTGKKNTRENTEVK
jgi:hypothetical protein